VRYSDPDQIFVRSTRYTGWFYGMTIKSTRNLIILPSLIIAVLSFLVFILAASRYLDVYDESIIVVGAIRVLNGDLIHRDFWTSYGPGQFYVLAFLFRLFGESFLVERIYDAAVRAAIVGALFYIVRRQCPAPIALISTAIVGLWLYGASAYLYPIFPCMLLSLIGSYLVTRVGERPAVPSAIIGAGVCTGLAALFRYDIGFEILIAHLVAITVLVWLSYPREARVPRIIKTTMAYCGGTAAGFALVAIAFLLVAPIGAFFSDVVEYATRYYPMRRLPFPGLLPLSSEEAVYLPLLAGALASIQLVPLIRQRLKATGPQTGGDYSLEYLTVFGIMSCALFAKGIVRVSALHMLLGIVHAIVVFAVSASLWRARGAAMRFASVGLLLFVSLFPASIATRELRNNLHLKDNSIGGWLAVRVGLIAPSLASSDVCQTGPASGIAKLLPDYARVATYLGAHSHADERILVGLDRHDKIFANPIGLYFAAGRLPGTHWHEFNPGIQTRADIQAAMVEELQRNKVRWVVRDATFDDVVEPNASALSSGVTVLDRYLDENYRPVASSGKVAIWLANGETPSPAKTIDKCEAQAVER
jgi:hypothetical protein